MTEAEKMTDIEKLKELFEYEMTEVRLMLEGQFASVSGKDIRGTEEPLIDEKKLTVNNVVIGNVDPVNIDLTLPDVPEAVLKQETGNETISAGPAVQLNDITVPEVSLDFLKNDISGKEIRLEKPEISLPGTALKDISAENIKAEINVDSTAVQVPEVSIPEVSFKAPESSPVHIEVPESSPQLFADELHVDLQPVAAAIPVIPEIPAFSVKEISHEETDAIQAELEKMVTAGFDKVADARSAILRAVSENQGELPESVEKAVKALESSRTYYTVDDL